MNIPQYSKNPAIEKEIQEIMGDDPRGPVYFRITQVKTGQEWTAYYDGSCTGFPDEAVVRNNGRRVISGLLGIIERLERSARPMTDIKEVQERRLLSIVNEEADDEVRLHSIDDIVTRDGEGGLKLAILLDIHRLLLQMAQPAVLVDATVLSAEDVNLMVGRGPGAWLR